MHVIKRLPLAEFADRHRHSAVPLNEWFRLTQRADWKTFADVRRTFGHTDLVKLTSENTVCVFDIGGNKFRLIAKVSYEKSKVYVLRVLTHKEYDAQKWKSQL